ncbi:MAG: hypothetical protein FD149_1067 [Rhodospirillaceae bacterium]|nr:MAG: hypothetical protein FD149_1067 [Rhodospirillaceae bacterium]
MCVKKIGIMTLRRKILLLGVLALGSLGIIFAQHLTEDLRWRTLLQDLTTVIQRAEGLSNVVHAFQNERGRSAAHLGAGDDHLLGALRAQWSQTDKAIAALPQSPLDMTTLATIRAQSATR